MLGSNIANLGLVLGIAAIMRSFRPESSSVERRALIFSVAVRFLLGAGAAAGASSVGRRPGAALLVVFVVYSRGDRSLNAAQDTKALDRRSAWKPAALSAAGLSFLFAGAEVLVHGAVALAATLDWPQELVGLSVVALGTSLPELFTSLAALRRGESAMVMGTVLGSNAFNLMFILGSTAMVEPIAFPRLATLDLFAFVALSGMLAVDMRSARPLGRVQGAILLLFYAVYLSVRFSAELSS